MQHSFMRSVALVTSSTADNRRRRATRSSCREYRACSNRPSAANCAGRDRAMQCRPPANRARTAFAASPDASRRAWKHWRASLSRRARRSTTAVDPSCVPHRRRRCRRRHATRSSVPHPVIASENAVRDVELEAVSLGSPGHETYAIRREVGQQAKTDRAHCRNTAPPSSSVCCTPRVRYGWSTTGSNSIPRTEWIETCAASGSC